MSAFPLLTAVAAVPAVGAVATAAVPAARRTAAKWTALGFALVTLVLACVVAGSFHPGGARYQLTESHAWISSFGVRYELGVDGIAVVLLLLTTVLIPFVMLAGWHDADLPDGGRPNTNWRPTQGFFALILLHIAAGLFHALIRRDGVFQSMAGGTQRSETRPAE